MIGCIFCKKMVFRRYVVLYEFSYDWNWMIYIYRWNRKGIWWNHQDLLFSDFSIHVMNQLSNNLKQGCANWLVRYPNRNPELTPGHKWRFNPGSLEDADSALSVQPCLQAFPPSALGRFFLQTCPGFLVLEILVWHSLVQDPLKNRQFQ